MAVAILTSVFVETLSALNSLGNSNVRFGSLADIACVSLFSISVPSVLSC